MSIVSKKKKPQQPAAATPDNGTPAPPRRPKRRRLIVLAVFLLVLALLVGLLPTIVTHTPLMAYFTRRAAMLDGGTITFRSSSIGWFSSASVSNIVIADAQGEPVLEADSLTCDRSLLNLLFRRSNAGTLVIKNPRFNVKLSRDGSNLETLIARWLTGPGSSSGQAVDMSLAVIDGEATIVDQETQQTWHVTGLQFALDTSRQSAWPTRMEAAATIDDGGRSGAPGGYPVLRVAGRLSLKSHFKASDAGAPGIPGRADPAAWGGLAGTDGDLSLQATALPLAMFQRLAAPLSPGLKLDGTLDSKIDVQWTGLATLQFDGSVHGADLCIESPSLGGDVRRLHEVRVACKAVREDKRLTIEKATFDGDLGHLVADGHVDLSEGGLAAPAEGLRQPDCKLRGTLDLAQLAQFLPGTLRVRPGTEIEIQSGISVNRPVAAGSRRKSRRGLPLARRPPPRPTRCGRHTWKSSVSPPSTTASQSPGTSRWRSTWPSTRPIAGRLSTTLCAIPTSFAARATARPTGSRLRLPSTCGSWPTIWAGSSIWVVGPSPATARARCSGAATRRATSQPADNSNCGTFSSAFHSGSRGPKRV